MHFPKSRENEMRVKLNCGGKFMGQVFFKTCPKRLCAVCVMFQSHSFVYCPVVFTFVTAYNFQNKMLAKCKDASGIFFFKQFAEVPGEISFLWSDKFW